MSALLLLFLPQSASTALKEAKARLTAAEAHSKDLQQQLAAARQQAQVQKEELTLARGQLRQLPLLQQQLQTQTAAAEQLRVSACWRQAPAAYAKDDAKFQDSSR
jgi:chromosome segregation ATPase